MMHFKKRSSQTVSAVLRGNVLSYKTNGPKKDFFLLNVMYALNLCFWNIGKNIYFLFSNLDMQVWNMLTSRSKIKLTPVLFKKKEKEQLITKWSFWGKSNFDLPGNRIDIELQNIYVYLTN